MKGDKALAFQGNTKNKDGTPVVSANLRLIPNIMEKKQLSEEYQTLRETSQSKSREH
jgi:hypothetical protein